MTARRLDPDRVQRVVTAAQRSRLDPGALRQASRALSVLRSSGIATLRSLLDRDLPESMSGAREWGVFRRQVAGEIRTLQEEVGVDAVGLYLAWLARRGRIEQARPQPSGATGRGRAGPRPPGPRGGGRR